MSEWGRVSEFELDRPRDFGSAGLRRRRGRQLLNFLPTAVPSSQLAAASLTSLAGAGALVGVFCRPRRPARPAAWMGVVLAMVASSRAATSARMPWVEAADVMMKFNRI